MYPEILKHQQNENFSIYINNCIIINSVGQHICADKNLIENRID
jgi:hypothetical protein